MWSNAAAGILLQSMKHGRNTPAPDSGEYYNAKNITTTGAAMNQIMDVLMKRRSVRAYDNLAISVEVRSDIVM
jgi:hypothetical protein